MFWKCDAWADVREPPHRKVTMMASKMTTLPRTVELWPPCLRMCGLPPQSVMEPLSPELRTLFMDSLLDFMCAVLVARMDRENQINAIPLEDEKT